MNQEELTDFNEITNRINKIKEYLHSCNIAYTPNDIDELLKDVNSQGFKIDYRLDNGKRIIAEAKTTTPIGRTFGAQQKKEMQKVLDKLKMADAEYKYLFVTNVDTANILHIQYSMDLVGITVEVV